MKIGILPRWAVGYLAIFLLLGASNLYTVVKLHSLGTTTIPSLNTDIRMLDYQKRLADSLLSQLRYERKYVLMKDIALHGQFLEANNEFHKYLAEGHALADTAQKRDCFRNIDIHQAHYERLVNEEVSYVSANSPYDRRRYLIEKDKTSDAILEELKNLEAYAREDVGLTMKEVSASGTSTMHIAFASSLAAVVCALLVSFFVTRSITTPLRKLVNKTREISAGLFNTDLDITSPPEIAELGRAFNSMCERLSAVDRMKTDFLSMISHELRTPLTTIKEGTSLLVEGVGGEITQKQERLLNILFAETNRLIDLVNSILDLSKMEAGMMKYTFGQASIVPLIIQAMTEITPLVESKKIVFQKRIRGDLPSLNMDPDHILRALRNLIGNAAKFTPEHGTITVSARALKVGVEISVEDTGPGISAEQLTRVFEKFSGSDNKRGTGLGLAVVKHIVAVHGGKVWAESKPEQGSKFIFVLPS
jgi:two-component system sensor histidine kinase GlrK